MVGRTNEDQTTTVDFVPTDPGHCKFVPPGPFLLDQGNTLAISFSNFPEGSTFTLLTLQSTTVSTKVVHFPSQPGDTPGIYSISSSGEEPPTELKIAITDIEKPTTAESYELSITGGLAGGGSWTADPEVINKPGQA